LAEGVVEQVNKSKVISTMHIKAETRRFLINGKKQPDKPAYGKQIPGNNKGPDKNRDDYQDNEID
jgi:hypothetical protein